MLLDANNAWIWLLGCIILVALFLAFSHTPCAKQKVPVFYSWIGAIAAFGGALAIILPVALNSGFGPMDDGRVLRQLILYTTGGVLGVVTLGETHRKNNIEKEKNKNDHIRQVHAERRSRYTKAVEQLADEKASLRLGGIYTLIGLIDEWIADSDMPEFQKQKEGQAIINSLCAYIRSPFPLARKRATLESFASPKDYEGDFEQDRTKLCDEREIRRAFFEEISNRLKSINKDYEFKIWNSFTLNLSGSDIFYPLNRTTFPKVNFCYSNFYGYANFTESIFNLEVDFSNSRFEGAVDFSNTHFKNNSQFSGSTFIQQVRFIGTHFYKTSKFTLSKVEEMSNSIEWILQGPGAEVRTTFVGDADFSKSTFDGESDFSGSHFMKKVNFSSATFTDATFREAIFRGESLFHKSTFNKKVSFYKSTFCDMADFLNAHFIKGVSFEKSEFGFPNEPDVNFKFDASYFGGNSEFDGCLFHGGAIFYGATFTNITSFHKARFFNEVDFHNAKSTSQHNAKKDMTSDAKILFSQASFRYPAIHDFKVAKDNPTLIDMGVVDFTLFDGTTILRSIPVGSYLFEFSPPDEENKRDTNVSDSSEPAEGSE